MAIFFPFIPFLFSTIFTESKNLFLSIAYTLFTIPFFAFSYSIFGASKKWLFLLGITNAPNPLYPAKYAIFGFIFMESRLWKNAKSRFFFSRICCMSFILIYKAKDI